MSETIESSRPSSTFQKPYAKVFGEVDHLRILQENQIIASETENNFADEICEILVNASDLEIFQCNIQGNRKYTNLLNRLLSLSNNEQITGAHIILNPTLVQQYDESLYTIFRCMSYGDGRATITGDAMLRIACEAINYEKNLRTPTTTVNKISVQSLSSGQKLEDIPNHS